MAHGKDHPSADVEGFKPLHRYINIFLMLMIILISIATTLMYINQAILQDVYVIYCVPKLSLACTFSFIILLCCYLVDDSSTFVFLASFTCIAFAAMNAFAGLTIIGISSVKKLFSSSALKFFTTVKFRITKMERH